MRTLLPGKPNARLQAVATTNWSSRSITFYISGNAIVILSGPQTIVQTIYDSDEALLCAIAVNDVTSRIAVSTDSTVRIYHPDSNVAWIVPRWSLELTIRLPTQHSTQQLSWGSSNELLVGSKSLYLYSTIPEYRLLWQTDLPRPANLAEISPDSSCIVAASAFDNLLKIWRRTSFGLGETRFDLTYVSHPVPITRLQWRKPTHPDASVEKVLFAFCADQQLRIWIPNQGNQHQLKKWGTVDLKKIDSDQASSRDPYAFLINAAVLTAAVTHELNIDDGTSALRTNQVQSLVALTQGTTELLVSLDGAGLMRLSSFQDIRYETRGEPPISRSIELQSTSLVFPMLASGHYLCTSPYCDVASGKLRFLFHYLGRQIEVFEISLSTLVGKVQSSSDMVPVSLVASWNGHTMPIKKIVRNYSGRAIVSRSENGECFVWAYSSHKQSLSHKSAIPNTGHIHRICPIRAGRFVVLIRKDEVSLWDCRQHQAHLVSSRKISVDGKPLCLVNLPRRVVEDNYKAHIATVTSEASGIVWEITLPHYDHPKKLSALQDGDIQDFCNFKLDGVKGLSYVLPVDPAGEQPRSSQTLDSFSRDVAVSYTKTGTVTFWTAKIHPSKPEVSWLSTASSETGIDNPALVSGSSLKRAALVNNARNHLTIWDIRTGRLEYDVTIPEPEVVQDLDWTSTPDQQSILSVGYQNKVELLSQSRFDYLHKGPAWAALREIGIREVSSYPIGDSTWLGDGSLVVGTGHQLFIYNRQVELSESRVSELQLPIRSSQETSWDMFDIVQRLNGPLPVFHPQFLSQCMVTGKFAAVRRILTELHKTLKYHVEGEAMHNYLSIPIEIFYSNQVEPTARSDAFFHHGIDDHDGTFDENTAATINEYLTKISLPQLSNREQIYLADIVECCGLIEKHRRSLDENGIRFLLFFRQHILRKGRTHEIQMSWREINWAFHSTSQDILCDFIDRQCHSKMLWQHARETGIFMWLSDVTSLKQRFEQIARNEYTKNENRSPVDCSIFYLALRRKNILQGLWRVAHGDKEQAATQRILMNDFSDPKWRTVARKNAYALLSKRRFQYAAAWFLLGDSLQEAVNICLKQLKDLQLAVAIARVYGGDNDPVFHRLLEKQVLPLASDEGNRWLTSWAFWMLGRKDMAVRAFISPVYTLFDTSTSPDYKSRTFLADDPSLIVLYQYLRPKTLQTLHGASKITPIAEWHFILHSANLYTRMGCDLLALDLVSNWEFMKVPHQQHDILDRHFNAASMLKKRRSSLVVDDVPMHLPDLGNPQTRTATDTGLGGFSEKTATVEEKPRAKSQPTLFVEPDASSLLDSFGF